MNRPIVKIDIVSDVVCPWCYIVKRRLEQAIVILQEHFDVKTDYHPFELNPHVPEEGYDQKAYLTQKFGGERKYEALTRHVSEIAAGEGLKFNFEIQRVTPNSLKAHKLIWYAGKENKKTELTEAFFKAYFEDGVDLSKSETLIEIAAGVGIDKATAAMVLANDQFTDLVKEEIQYYKSLGVTGVPFYIINEKYGISGAQPANVFVESITKINEDSVNSGDSCDLEGNCNQKG